MKNRNKLNLLLSLFFSVLFLMFSSIVNSQTVFTVATPDGYATGTTGGGNASPQIVSSPDDFKSAAESNTPAVIVVKGTINIEAFNSVMVNSNKTIIGADSTSTLLGNLKLDSVTNVIIQNININNSAGAGTEDGIEATNYCNNIFVHKCTFIDCKDGSFDIKHGSDNVTVTWCRFKYPTRTTHCFPNLIGHNDNNGDEDRGKLHVTMHHNWYDKGCKQRMPRVRFGQVHCYNNYYSGPLPDLTNDYVIGVGVESSILLENSYFENITNTWWNWKNSGVQGKIEWKNLHQVNTTLSDWAPNSDVFNPPYIYSMDNSVEVKSLLTNPNFGAGNCKTKIILEPTNIVSKKNKITIHLFPNPIENYFKIKGYGGVAIVKVLDLSGKLIILKNVVANESIDVGNLVRGIYMVRITTEEGTIDKKLIKN